MKLMSQHFTTLSQHKELKMVENICRDKRQLCLDTKFRVSVERQEDLSRQRSFMLQQTQHKVKVKSVKTKASIVTKKVEMNYKTNVTM